uniref:Glucose-6-phosphate isomerase n=2 Tax=16SrI (Aster yellows group) TaxID=3042590 RepID=A6QKM5_ONYPH|nr:glucose-6-phosphate isomerase [Onion yellows phytoplasma OY-W]
MMKGALQAYHDTFQEDLFQNQAYQYALARYLLHIQQNKKWNYW